ncbi:MAG: single-stranded DNA-binding protein [Desulfobacterales bacterium]|jgi:single-strand DNA-binding protein|nr:single-stranded DNA-binding protein [Desulfobacterales bacterium]
MSGFNQLQIIGNIGKSAEIKTLPGGKRVLSFSLAVNEKRGQEDITTWFDCSMFGERLEALGPLLSKGKQVFVQGPISSRSWTSQTGEARSSMSVLVNKLVLCGSKRDEAYPGDTPTASYTAPRPTSGPAADLEGPPFDDDTIPF